MDQKDVIICLRSHNSEGKTESDHSATSKADDSKKVSLSVRLQAALFPALDWPTCSKSMWRATMTIRTGVLISAFVNFLGAIVVAVAGIPIENIELLWSAIYGVQVLTWIGFPLVAPSFLFYNAEATNEVGCNPTELSAPTCWSLGIGLRDSWSSVTTLLL